MKKVVAAFVAISVALIAFFAGWLAAKGPAVAVELMTKDIGLKAQWQQLDSVKSFDQIYTSIGSIRDMIVSEAETEHEVVQGMIYSARSGHG